MRVHLPALMMLLACGGALAASPKTADEPTKPHAASADTPPDHASPSVCVVILGLQQQAVKEGRATGDIDALASAYENFRSKAAVIYDGNADQADQKIRSRVPLYDELTPEQLSRAAGMCLAAVGEEFSSDK